MHEFSFAANKWSPYHKYKMELTAGRRFETAVPDDVMTTAGV